MMGMIMPRVWIRSTTLILKHAFKIIT